jgi:galactokinase
MTPTPPAERILREVRHEVPRSWYRAPGRVNLMGDHTDYNDGFVLPLAIDRETVIAVDRAGEGRVRVRTLDAPAGEDAVVEVAADGSDDPASVPDGWGRYVAAVVAALAERGCRSDGFDAVLASSVPVGSGLSSSAALEVACALAALGDDGLGPVELAQACQRAEHRATGVPSGIMDQLTSAAGEEGSALRIDCRTLGWEPVPLPASMGVVVVHTGVARTLAGSAYAERRAACEAAARRLRVPALRDARPEQVADDPIARHVVHENARVGETAAALAAEELDEVGRLMLESHASLRDDYRVSIPELDRLVELLVGAGAFGARLTGAGFGGCVVAATPAADADAIARGAAARYAAESGREPTPFVVSAAAGAGPMPSPG